MFYPLFDIPVRYLQVQVEYLNRQRIFGATIYSHGNAKLVLNSMILFLSQQDLISSQNSVTYTVIYTKFSLPTILKRENARKYKCKEKQMAEFFV